MDGDRLIQIYRNGDIEQRRCEVINLSKNIELKQLFDIIKVKFHLKGGHFRLFNYEGVELFQDDIPYLKPKAVLYFSKGEDFDARSSFSEYITIKELGEGGFGRVLLGQHRVTNEKVAIKIVNTSMIGNAEHIDMVFREAEMLKSLHHRNIVKIHNCYTLPNMEVVFIMEYLEGGELLDYVINKESLSEQEACDFFVQIVEGIQYCHSQKLIHRDLKLENILLVNSDSQQIKIVDFGLAGLANNFNISKIDMGTLRYMPPEILTGRTSEIGPQIDIWALGIILYGMVAGTLPFDGDNNQDVANQIIKLKYRLPANSSQELRNLLMRILVQDPHKRIKSQQILEHPWVINNCKASYTETGQRIKMQQMQQNDSQIYDELTVCQTRFSRKKTKKKVGISESVQKVEDEVSKAPLLENPQRNIVQQNTQKRSHSKAYDQKESKLHLPKVSNRCRSTSVEESRHPQNSFVGRSHRQVLLPKINEDFLTLKRQLNGRRLIVDSIVTKLRQSMILN